MEKNNKISIVIPVLDEAESVGELYKKIINVVNDHNFAYEIIFVDDGSTDDSFKIIENLYQNDRNIKAIQFRKNFGKSAALAAGFKQASGGYIITMDADLQDDPKEITSLIDKLDSGYDLVSGWKHQRKDPITKKIPSKVFNFLVKTFTGNKLHDINCGLKAYRKEVIEEIELHGDLYRFLPVLAEQKGFKVGEIKVEHHKRKFGKTKYGAKRFLTGLIDLLTVMLLTKYIQKPGHFFGSGGILALGAGLIINFYLSMLWFLERPIGNRPLLMLGILLMIIGIQLISLGLLGEMLSNQRKEKKYTIKKILK